MNHPSDCTDLLPAAEAGGAGQLWPGNPRGQGESPLRGQPRGPLPPRQAQARGRRCGGQGCQRYFAVDSFHNIRRIFR